MRDGHAAEGCSLGLAGGTLVGFTSAESVVDVSIYRGLVGRAVFRI